MALPKKLGTKVYSHTKQQEDDSIKVLREILASDKVDTSKIWEGNHPNTDGRFELINDNREYTSLKFDVQIKSIGDKTKPRIVCDAKFLKHCSLSNAPVFLL